jgi:UDP-2,4-diacetamido-2,4,6-trideoxy-beta-L-altropyranose hydrolase
VRPYKAATDLLGKNSCDYRTITDNSDFLSSLSGEETDIVIFDIRDTKREDIKPLKNKGIKIVSFDDRGEGSVYADLLIDANRDPKSSLPGQQDLPRRCFGPEYMILNEKFHSVWERKREIPEKVNSVLITMGGSDPLNLSRKLFEILKNADREIFFRLVLGPAYDDTKIISDFQGMRNLEIVIDSGSMEELMYESDLIFCSGGITLYEAMACGTPAFVINQNEHQLEIAGHFHEMGAVRNLGRGGESSSESVFSALCTSREERETMSRKGKKIVDGKGLERISGEILRMVCCYEYLS